MYAFVDESGDTGFKGGSSDFLTVSLVGFNSWEDMCDCDDAIQEFKDQNRISPELHFVRDHPNLRRKFLEYISNYEFFFYGHVINKGELYPHSKSGLYEFACMSLLGVIAHGAGQSYIDSSRITFDGAGEKKFQESFRNKLSSITKYPNFKPQLEDSQNSNLLQLADYVAGSINKSLPTRKGKQDISYVRAILDHYRYVKVWPTKGNFSSPDLRKYWES